MSVFLGILGAISFLVILGLATVGLFFIINTLWGADPRRQIDEQTRQAEQEISRIGRQTQAAIFAAAVQYIQRPRNRHPIDPDSLDEQERR